jgi:hypothetical protein
MNRRAQQRKTRTSELEEQRRAGDDDGVADQGRIRIFRVEESEWRRPDGKGSSAGGWALEMSGRRSERERVRRRR